jgi:hypothetical protein
MKPRTLHLYNLVAPVRHRWIPGDQYPRALARSLLQPFRGTPPIGLTKWGGNLCLGLDRIGHPWRMHHRPDRPGNEDVVGILHGPLDQVRVIASAQRCVTGVGVLNFPDEWPTFFEDTKTIFHLQSCEWAAEYYRPAFGERIRLYAVGIDTERYAPRPAVPKDFDVLVYNKLRWPAELPEPDLRERCLEELDRRGLTYHEVQYGRYPGGKESGYHDLVARSRSMLFLCENETQGIAYNEALSMGVPILAWNPGRWLDPNRHSHGFSNAPASSVPYWDARCGEQFTALAELPAALDRFCERLRAGAYAPREYILDYLTLEACARDYVRLLAEAAQVPV